ncbi:hypothetical protein OPT61_g1979 [Boeremia exigua]|uniref:Uncharacterized protein n=1 Tax=Boeremia exigua TaxID=749465 RepID=A0ACC2IN72_9PLEO|nr:hypothetical protein OPT61_g1979 [Boeremia exigua]
MSAPPAQPHHNTDDAMTSDTPVDALTRELARYLESAVAKGISKLTLTKHFKEKLAQLQPLRPSAQPVQIENLYNVGAWYLLFGYPPKFPPYGDPADADLFSRSRHIIALTNLRRDWKQPDTIPRVCCLCLTMTTSTDYMPATRGAARRDSAAYVARTRLSGKSLQNLPSPKVWESSSKGLVFSARNRRCVIPSELGEFYDEIVQSWICNSLKPTVNSRKRRKLNLDGQPANTDRQDEDEDEISQVELPRRSNAKNNTAVAESSSARQDDDSILQHPESPTQLSATGDNLNVDKSELEIGVEQSLVDDDSLQQPFPDDFDQTELQREEEQHLQREEEEHLQREEEQHPQREEEQRRNDNHIAMSRKQKQSRSNRDEQAQKEVNNAFEDLLDGDHGSGFNAGVKWLIDTAARRESLRKRIEATTAARDVAEDAVAKIHDDISTSLPMGNKDLNQAIRNAEAALEDFTAKYDQAVALANQIQAGALRGFFTNHTGIDELRVNAQKTKIEEDVEHLKYLAAALETQSKVQEQKAKELEILDEKLADCEEALRKTAKVYRLATEDATCAAVNAYGVRVNT